MTPRTNSRIAMFVAGAALAFAGFMAGSNQRPVQAADEAGEAATSAGLFGVSIPNGGAALVKGKDGYAYIVDTRGVFVRASQSGKGLLLP